MQHSCRVPQRDGQPQRQIYKALYNFSLSHKFTEDLMVYATTGTSFRSGLPAINNPGLPADLVTPAPETATSYELGVKSSFGRGLTVNAAVFQLDYKDQLTTFEGVQYFNTVSAMHGQQTSLCFLSQPRCSGSRFRTGNRSQARRQSEPGGQYQLLEDQVARAALSRATIRPVPINAANPINFCPSPKGQVLNTRHRSRRRSTAAMKCRSAMRSVAISASTSTIRAKTPILATSALAARSRAPHPMRSSICLPATGSKGAWDLGFYAKNVFDKQVELARVATLEHVYPAFAAPSGYDVVRTILPREIGVYAALRLRFALSRFDFDGGGVRYRASPFF